jgi:hypothetical protein
MLNWDINSLNLMHEEHLKQAEKDRQAQDFIEEIRKTNPHYNPTLSWFGHRFMDFGGKLLQMSGSEEDRKSVIHPNIHLN